MKTIELTDREIGFLTEALEFYQREQSFFDSQDRGPYEELEEKLRSILTEENK